MQPPMVLQDAWLRHDRTILNLYARPQPCPLHPKSKNLWEEIQKFSEKFIVDNHVPWSQYARRKECANTAFVLGTSALNENTKLMSIFEEPGGKRRAHRNVFLFGPRDLEYDQRGCLLNGKLVIDRLDETAISVFDRGKLSTFGDHRILKKARDEAPRDTEKILHLLRIELLLLLVQRGGLTPTMGIYVRKFKMV